jgi:hypothetical protein
VNSAFLHLEQSAVSGSEMSSKSPGFIKWYLNLFVAKASQSWRMCEAISEGCWRLSHLELYTSPSLKRCPFKWQCPVSNPVIILSWSQLRLSNSPAFFAEVFFKKALSVPLSTCGLMLLVFYLSSPGSPPWQPLQIHHVQADVLLVDMKSLVSSIVSFQSIPVCPGTNSNWILLCSANFTTD